MSKTPLITPMQAERFLLRRQLQHDADRCAALICWSVYSKDDARKELRGQAYILAQINEMNWNTAILADEMLEEALDRHEGAHRVTFYQMRDVALHVLHSGGTAEDAAKAAAEIARNAVIRPPADNVRKAVEKAIREAYFERRRKPARV